MLWRARMNKHKSRGGGVCGVARTHAARVGKLYVAAIGAQYGLHVEQVHVRRGELAIQYARVPQQPLEAHRRHLAPAHAHAVPPGAVQRGRLEEGVLGVAGVGVEAHALKAAV